MLWHGIARCSSMGLLECSSSDTSKRSGAKSQPRIPRSSTKLLKRELSLDLNKGDAFQGVQPSMLEFQKDKKFDCRTPQKLSEVDLKVQMMTPFILWPEKHHHSTS